MGEILTCFQYCSKDCQKENWKTHKITCKSKLMQVVYVPAWVTEGRTPALIGDDQEPAFHGKKEFLWGNMPALNILKLRDNEDVIDVERDFDLLFAASGDLRNVVKTIVGLLDDYRGTCSVTVNDMNFTVVARNIILLLVALHFGPETAVPIMIHVQYSALLPAVMVELLRKDILPYIQDVNIKTKGKPADSFQAKTFNFAKGSFRVVLQKTEWIRLTKVFEVPPGLTKERAISVRRTAILAPQRVDYLDRALYKYSPSLRAGVMKYRGDGILLPFGCSIKEFDTPNP
jgi:hypothetical protein